MKKTCFLTCVWIALASGALLATDLADVLANPNKYDRRHVELVGIARVPGYFYLFADMDAAAKTDLSKALLIRKNNFTQPEYRELDRQWVRVTGVMSEQPKRGWDPGGGVLLDRVELLRDRPPPRIADRTVLGVFENDTEEALAIQLVPSSERGVGTLFFLKPGDVTETEISEGRAVASQLKGPKRVSLDKREIGKPIACGEIAFGDLPADYQHSPEWSLKRRLYFRILSNRIELVPASETRDWKLNDSVNGGANK